MKNKEERNTVLGQTFWETKVGNTSGEILPQPTCPKEKSTFKDKVTTFKHTRKYSGMSKSKIFFVLGKKEERKGGREEIGP